MLAPQVIAKIKACHNVYSVGDTARFFGVSKETVHAVWSGRRHSDVVPASEPENISSSRISPQVIKEDARMLLARGMGIDEVAKTLGISTRTVRRHVFTKEASAPALMVFR